MKKIFGIFIVVSMLLEMCGTSFAYIETAGKKEVINVNFENKNAIGFNNEGNYTLKSGDKGVYMSVSGTAKSASQAPGYNLSVSGKVTMEFDLISPARGAVFLQMDGGEYKEFFLFADFENRGPLVRDKSGVAQFFFGSNSINANEWNKFVIEYDTEAGTVSGSVNGHKANVGEYTIINYTKSKATKPPVYQTGKITGIRFGTGDSNDASADNGFDNIKISVEKNEKKKSEISSDKQYEFDLKKLDYLNVLDDVTENKDKEDFLTKEEFVYMLAKIIKMPEKTGNGDVFADVKIKNKFSGYIESLYNKGYIEFGDGKFRPEKKMTLSQATDMILRVLGYTEENAKYMSQKAEYKDIVKGITVVSGEQYVSMHDAVTMFSNSLTVPMLKIVYEGLNENSEDETILSKYYSLTEEEVFIEKVNYNSRELGVTDFKGENKRKIETNNVSLLNVEGTYRYVWQNDDEEVVFMSPYKNSQTAYGYITEYNEKDDNKAIVPGKLKNVLLSVLTEKVSVSDDFKLYKNGIETTSEISLVGKAVRVTVNNNQIVRMDILSDGDVNEGGIITDATEEKILYTKGEESYLNLDLEIYNEYITVLNGREISYDKVTSGSIFDYIICDGRMILFVSDLVYEGKMTGMSAETVKLGDKVINCSKDKMYISTDGGNSYNDKNGISSFMGSEIVAMCDMSGEIRYVMSEETGKYYGVVIKGFRDEETDEPALSLSLLINGKMKKDTYIYKNKKNNVYYPEVSYNDACLNAKDKTGKGVYKFELSNGKIKAIEAIEWANDGIMMAMNGNMSATYKRFTAGGKSWYYKDKMISLLDVTGEFNPQAVPLNLAENRYTNGMKALVEKTKPISEIVVVDSMYNGFYSQTVNMAFVSKVNEVYENDEIYLDYELEGMSSSTTVRVKKENELRYSGLAVERGDLIYYCANSLRQEAEAGFTLFAKINMEDVNWDDFGYHSVNNGATDSAGYGTLGIIKGFNGDFVKVQQDSEEVWYRLATSNVFLKYESGKVERVDKSEAIGMKAIANMQGKDVPNMIIVTE